ncbi:MAG TPA: hypothetical protein PKC18_12455 [Lacipirellulaceae bacterium]|nr:hypothetical protein [Lacipirellulaceae bacterium]
MSNALAVLSNGKAELTELEQAILAEVESDAGQAYDYVPTRIKFPSGGMMAFSTNDGEILKPPFTAIVAVAQKARAFWPDKDTQGLPPLCASPDGSAGMFDTAAEEQVKVALGLPFRHPALDMLDPVAAKGPHSCATCSLAQWGSGSGRGQLCKALRRLVLVVEGWSMPAIITLPPTSVKVWDAYASAVARTKGQAYFTAWTKFDLDPATSTIRRQYSDLVRGLGIDADDYATVDTADARRVDVETGEIIDGGDLPPF